VTVEEWMPLGAGDRVTFSADRAHALVFQYASPGQRLALDGREIACCASSITHTALAPDGAWVAYLASRPLPAEEQVRTRRSVEYELVYRGVVTALPSDPAGLAVTPDGTHVATAVNFSLEDSGEVVLDGVTVSRGLAPRLLTLSPDGARWAVVHDVDRYGGGETVTIDGRRSPAYGAIWGLLFSPDGQHVAYKAVSRSGESSRLVVDGVVSRPYDLIDDELVFTSDGRIVARTWRDGVRGLRIGDDEFPSGDPLETVVAGATVAWIDEVHDSERRYARALVDGVERYRVDTGVYREYDPGDRGPAIFGLVVAPDAQTLAFATSEGVWVVGPAQPPSPAGAPDGPRRIGEVATPLAFDETASRLAVLARGPSGSRVEIWSTSGSAPPAVGPEHAPPDEIFADTTRWVGDRVEYFARRGPSLVRVTHEPRAR
jgi:hypothetical protein